MSINQIKSELSGEWEFLGRYEDNGICDACGNPTNEINTVGKVIPLGVARDYVWILCDNCLAELKR